MTVPSKRRCCPLLGQLRGGLSDEKGTFRAESQPREARVRKAFEALQANRQLLGVCLHHPVRSAERLLTRSLEANGGIAESGPEVWRHSVRALIV
jgi:hypothetical protein